MAFVGPNAKNYISTATTTQVTTAGEANWLLEGLVVGAATTGTVKIYDDDNGTSDIFLDYDAGLGQGSHPIGVLCTTGIRVVTSEADKVTIVFRKL